MKNIFQKINHWLHCEYRLAIFDEDKAAPSNLYSRSRSFMRRYIKNLNVPYWTLYRRGPFGLSEHVVTWGGYMCED